MNNSEQLRIVSLLPSATEIVASLGLTDALVGRSHECDYPPEVQKLPVCTQARINAEKPSATIHQDVTQLVQSALSIYEIKLDVLEELQPTHILTQDQCDICAVSVADVETAVAKLTNSHPQVISLQPQTLADVWTDIQKVGVALNVSTESVIKNLEARVKICEQKTQSLLDKDRPKVLCVEWIEPLMVASNWIPEMVKIAGGKPLFSVIGQPSPKLTWETVFNTNPDIIIFMPCGFDLDRTRQEVMSLTQQPEWENLQAVQKARVYLTDGNAYFNRPGPRLAESVEILADILHPETFQYGYQNQAWQQL
ncbi:cobalamin-binding protein [Aerosakkonemataceae cyanobacterium BLCC-F154]|uniref:Cobalamin-binding protein n=1 Tax=Floridaenema fluviatile BLCC-F154 TaxID=3153640 RepID=A0ABV4YN70_9CYAN